MKPRWKLWMEFAGLVAVILAFWFVVARGLMYAVSKWGHA